MLCKHVCIFGARLGWWYMTQSSFSSISTDTGVPSFFLHNFGDFHRIPRSHVLVILIRIWQAWCDSKQALAQCERWSCYMYIHSIQGTIRTIQGTIGTIRKARKWARYERSVGTIGTIGNDLWARLERFLRRCLRGHDGHDYRECYARRTDFRAYFEILLALTTHSFA